MKTNHGFTLLEILVALAVFAILATITSSTMYHAFDTRAHVTMQADRLSELQLAIALITRDTQQIVDRAIYGNELRSFPPFTGQKNYIEFTRGGEMSLIGNEMQGTLKRVAYLCRADQLIRRSWNVLDGPNRAQSQDKVILTHLNQCKFAYLAHNQQILPEWREYALQTDQRQETRPAAIQVTLNLNDWGTMNLLFIIPGALYAE